MSKIVLRTHGGLGNQFFQVYFALCCKFEFGYQRVVIIHDNTYPHKFGLDEKLQTLGQRASLIDYLASALRLPKLLNKFFGMRRETIAIGRTIFLDGYFQDVADYAHFSTASLRTALSELRLVVGGCGDMNAEAPPLEHIRLGDFFESKASEEASARTILQNIKRDSHIVTNNESLVKAICAEGDVSAKLTLISTEGMSGADLLNLMAKYAEIRSNDSTLALWAALLYGRRLELNSSRLQKFFVLSSELSEHGTDQII